MQHRTQPDSRGFTLVELLVVILIISILLTIGAGALKSAGGKGVSTALAGCEALFDEARSVAVGRGTTARVLVDIDDPSNEAYYLRRVAVAYQELDENGEPTETWKLAGRAYTMPDKVFFSQDYSKAGAGKLDQFTLTGNGGNYNGKYLYYEFNSEGICTTGLSGGEDYQSPSFVIGAGARGLGQQKPRTTADGRRDFAGFVVWRNGATSLYRDPAQIIGGAEPTQF